MKTIHPAVAQHAMEENEKLRGLLREIAEGCTRRDMPSEQTVTKWADRIDAALSQQAEPTDTFTAVDMATAAAQGFRDGQAAAEQAPAQDEQPAVFWVLFDATTPEPYIKKMMPEGFLAFFDCEEDAIRAKSFHPGTNYKRVPYVRQSAHLAALSAVTAEVEGLRKDAERWRYVSLQGDDMHWLNLLRVDLDDFGGNINAAVDALIDGEAPAMAAKDRP